MNKFSIRIGAALIAAAALAASVSKPFAPGSRTELWAHNAYPDHGKYGERLDRAISAGTPFMVEEDLAWIDQRSLLIHGAKNVSEDDPTLESYFFPKVQPIMEKALAEGNHGNWPLVILYLDIKNDPPEHLEAISKLLDKYDAWLTKAVKTQDISVQSPLELKPMMVLVEDKHDDIKQDFFYDRVPVGGKLRVFGSVTKYDNNIDKKLSKQTAIDGLFDVPLERIFTKHADNYRRWWGIDWSFIEKGGEPNGGEWTKEKEQRLRRFVDYGHHLGYFVGAYGLSGWTTSENQGWDKDYNFGSREAVLPRWHAAIRSHLDFIATDQYEDLAKLIHESKK